MGRRRWLFLLQALFCFVTITSGDLCFVKAVGWNHRFGRQNNGFVSRTWLPLVLLRGGGEDASQTVGKTTTTVRYRVISHLEKHRIHCYLVQSNQPVTTTLVLNNSCRTNNKERRSLLQTLALLSNVLILDPPPMDDDDLQQMAIYNGLRKRNQSVNNKSLLPPATVILMAESDVHRRQLALNWHTITPEVVEEFVILVPDERSPNFLPSLVQAQRKELQLAVSSFEPSKAEDDTTVPIEYDAFPALLQAVYEHYGGKQERLVEYIQPDPKRNQQLEAIASIPVETPNIEMEAKLSSTATTTGKHEESIVAVGATTTSETASRNLDTTDKEEDVNEVMVWERIQLQMDELQSKMEANQFDDSTLPLNLKKVLSPIRIEMNRLTNEPSRAAALGRLHDLYVQHLQVLRDHYGNLYENLLDRNTKLSASQMQSMQSKLMGQFGKAILMDIGGVDTSTDISTVIKGLKADFDAITEQRVDNLSSLLDSDDDDENEKTAVSEKRAKLQKWGKQIGKRALMLAVNYLQGWLAYQGIKRNALERERDMPKFPLF